MVILLYHFNNDVNKHLEKCSEKPLGCLTKTLAWSSVSWIQSI